MTSPKLRESLRQRLSLAFLPKWKLRFETLQSTQDWFEQESPTLPTGRYVTSSEMQWLR